MRTAEEQTKGQAGRCPRCDSKLDKGEVAGHCPVCLLEVVRPEEPEAGAEPFDLERPGTDRIGRYFAEYEVLQEIAHGGMGLVYKARHCNQDRVVALKVIAAEHLSAPKAIERFHTEVRAASCLDHPNIVPVYETGQVGARHYFTMKLVEGRSLSERKKDFQLLPASGDGSISKGKSRTTGREVSIARLLAKVASAVHYAHQRGILHRDLKPGNILIDAADEPHVTDFGLAKRVESDSSLTLSGEVLGTPAYMAPEQAAGNARQVTTASDVYSLGVILYELLAGQPPFQKGTALATLHAALTDEPMRPRILNTSVPRDLETICLKCLEKQPAKRYTSAGELEAELLRFLRGEPILARPISFPERIWRWCKRKPALAISIILIHLVLLLGLAGILWQWRRAEFNALQNRESLYAADMTLAHQALAADNLRQCIDLLRRHIPVRGEPDFRGFEWRYLWRHCQSEELASLPGHLKSVDSVAFSPGGRLLASGSYDGSIKLWEVRTRKLLATLTNHSHHGQVAFSPVKPIMVSVAIDGGWLWDLNSFRALRRLTNATIKAAFSPNGDYLATGTTNGIMLWDAKSWQPAGNFALSGQPNMEGGSRKFNFGFSSEGHRLLVVCNEGVRVLTVPALLEIALFAGNYPRLRPLAVSPGGENLAIGFTTNSIRLIDPNTGAEKLVLKGHSGSVYDLGFSADGQRLVTSSADQTIKLWDVTKPDALQTFRGHTEEIWCVAISPDGKLIASGGKDGQVKLWGAHSSHPDSLDLPGITLGFDGAGQLWMPGPGETVAEYDPETLARISVMRAGAEPEKVTSSLPFRSLGGMGYLAAFIEEPAGPSGAKPGCPGRHMLIRDLRAQTNLSRTAVLLNQELFCPAPRAGLLAVRADRDSIGLFKLPDLAPVCRLSHPGELLALSPQGDLLAALDSNRRNIQVWQVAGSTVKPICRIPADEPNSVAFSPDGELMAAATQDALIRIWRPSKGTLVTTMTGHKRAGLSIAFSPDGKTLASGAHDGTVRLWHIGTGRELFGFQVMINENNYSWVPLGFSPDGRTLAGVYGSEPSIITRVWFTPSLAEIAVAEGLNYAAQAGTDAASWLSAGTALARRGRTAEAASAFTKAIQYCRSGIEMEPVRIAAIRGRDQLGTGSAP